MSSNKNVNVPVFVKRNGMLINRECLDIDDPEILYNYLKNNNYCPEEYGVNHPYEEIYKELTRYDLIDKIMKLEKEICSYELNQIPYHNKG